MRVLVGYATAAGSTRGVAERIAARLSARGHVVDTHELTVATDLTAHDAFVLGSAVHNQSWLPGAREAVDGRASLLATRPVWLFSVGMPAALPRWMRGWAASAEQDKVVADLAAAIAPRDHRLFSGVIRRQDLGRVGGVAVRVLGGRYGDFRDWEAIDAWADGIADALAT
jgi:menaquinone-dependent protoporphyrinogen oxidase